MRSAPAGIPKRLYNYAGVLFLLTLLLRIIIAGYYNSNFGGIESNVVYGIQRILLGQPLYQDPTANTYAVMQYTPVYYYFTATLAKTIGIHALDVAKIYMLCRALALAFNLLTIFLAAMVLRSWNFSFSRSVLYSLPVVIILTTHYYTRGDSMHLCFFVAAICSYVWYRKSRAVFYLITAAIATAICIMVKQSGILVAGIIGLHLLFFGRKYLAATLYATLTLAAAYTLVWLCTGGAWLPFYQNAYLGLKNGIDLSFLYNIFISQFYYEIVPCYFLLCVLVYVAVTKITDTTFRILVMAAALSWLFAVVTGIKIGSSNNYFVEFLVFILLSLPYLFSYVGADDVLFRLTGVSVSIRFFAGTAFFILITSKTLGFFTAVYIDKRLTDERHEFIAEQQLYTYFREVLHIHDGEHILFTERNFLDNIFIQYSLIPTKDVVSQIYLCDSSTYNYSRFAGGMNNGLIKYIVTDSRKKDINRWHQQIPFMLINTSKLRWMADTLGYSIYIFTPIESVNKS